ncbi:MAG: ABC transporter substrate-binding protein [Brevinemataceae bacterium]
MKNILLFLSCQRQQRILSMLLLAMIFVTSCGSPSKDLQNKLRVAVPAEPITLFPYHSNDNSTARVLVQIYDRLFDKNSEGDIIPSLARTWKFISPTVLQIEIRTNVKFHNGAILTAQDVKYSLETMIKTPQVHHIASPIKNIEVIDDKTLNINLKASFAPILSHLAHPVSAIINQAHVEKIGNQKDQLPVGTGPFVLDQWNRGQNVILKKFDEYWGNVAKIDELEFKVVPEASSRTIALEAGDIDIAYDIDPIDRDRIKENSKLQLIEAPIARVEYLGFNLLKNPIWKDKKVRQAVAYAIDIPGIINSVLFGAGMPAGAMIYESVFGFNDQITYRKQNIEKAKQLITEAGIKPGTKVVMWATEGQRQKILEIIQANLREIGLDASVQVYEWSRFIDGTAKGEHDLFILGWTTITDDADYGLYNLLHTTAQGATGNRSFYSNPIVDAALDAAREEQNSKKREKIYQDIQLITYEDIPMIPLYYKISSVGLSKRVHGFIFDSSDAHRLQFVFIQ